MEDKTGKMVMAGFRRIAAGLGVLAVALIAVVPASRADFVAKWTAGGVIAAPSPGHYQGGIKALPDGQNGVFLVWTEYTEYVPASGWTGSDIKAQHLDKDGNPLWGASGIAVSAVAGEQDSPAVTADGAGGIIVTWTDSRSGFNDSNIYAQRILANGSPQWTADGVVVCSAPNIQQHSVICSDGSHGAVIAWEDFRNSLGPNTEEDIYAQRVLADGTMSWTSDGVPVMKAAGVHFGPYIVGQASGGAVVGWTDNGTSGVADVKAAEVSSAGSVSARVIVCDAPGDQVLNDLKSDGKGGYLFAWYDYRNGTTNSDVYIQLLNASMSPQWASNGLAIATAPADEYQPTLVTNGDGSAEVEYLAAGAGVDLLAARVSAAGTVAWTGSAICVAAGDQTAQSGASDGKGGMFTAWQDQRTSNPDVYVQHMSDTGGALWTADGSPLAASAFYEQAPVVVTDGAGGAIVAWEDWHDVSAGQAYVQRIADAASADTTPPTVPAVNLSTGFASSTSAVTATWSSTDPESGISGYELGLGSASGTADVSAFASAGTATSASIPTAGLAEGTYYVTVRATNGAGLTSTGSSGALVIDNTLPTALISAPAARAYVRGSVTLSGTASDANFDHATLEWGAGSTPAAYAPVTTLTAPVSNGTLGTWNTTGLQPGPCALRLTVVDKAGNSARAVQNVNLYVAGDVDGDGQVTVHDAVLLLGIAAGLAPANALSMAAGDMAPKPSAAASGYGDARIDLLDAMRVLRAASSLDSLP